MTTGASSLATYAAVLSATRFGPARPEPSVALGPRRRLPVRAFQVRARGGATAPYRRCSSRAPRTEWAAGAARRRAGRSCARARGRRACCRRRDALPPVHPSREEWLGHPRERRGRTGAIIGAARPARFCACMGLALKETHDDREQRKRQRLSLAACYGAQRPGASTKPGAARRLSNARSSTGRSSNASRPRRATWRCEAGRAAGWIATASYATTWATAARARQPERRERQGEKRLLHEGAADSRVTTQPQNCAAVSSKVDRGTTRRRVFPVVQPIGVSVLVFPNVFPNENVTERDESRTVDLVARGARTRRACGRTRPRAVSGIRVCAGGGLSGGAGTALRTAPIAKSIAKSIAKRAK